MKYNLGHLSIWNFILLPMVSTFEVIFNIEKSPTTAAGRQRRLFCVFMSSVKEAQNVVEPILTFCC